jgi:TetR/AcrR family transcriptional regulator, regulator of cefoperazone and chloramphenicol sensitivity
MGNIKIFLKQDSGQGGKMLIQNSALHDNETCRRLVAAASEEFAQHGFAGARIRAIVDAAGVNLAAVNYYFGGKEGLYRATLGYLAGQAMAGFSSRAAERRGQSPERRLHRVVYGFLAGLTDSATAPPLGRILAHEAMSPSPHLDRLIEEMTRPQLERLRGLVREIAGPSVPERELTVAALGIAGQCLIFLFGRPAVERIFPGAIGGAHATQTLARQITEGAIASLAALGASHAAVNREFRPSGPPLVQGETDGKSGSAKGH